MVTHRHHHLPWFALPCEGYDITVGSVKEHFPIEAAIAAYRSQFLTASNDCSRPKKKPTISPRGNSVPPSKGYGHQVRQGELDADLMDFGGGHHRTVSNPPSSSSVYPGITSRSSTPAAPQVRAEDLNREALKAARLKAKEERIRAKHEEFASRQREETTKREAKLDAQGRLAEELDHWAYTEQGKPKDIRTLLSNMEEALWPNSGWNAVSAGELMVNTGAVKKAYRKAIILCHPDRHQSASPDEQYRADRIFNALNEAFKRQ
ncbi:homeobox-containing protein, putative [Perkinsus marinus ATCC 50983]|uniref:Homeobox-containing protein, putative n=1 Tax=Perkinsus marinus (strain ATCC 50983 / TXsc) TaxID=423536 RepID=C5LI80_PERM5|nr:homeobox-containing protein, putative [Perkinsus marinus ATCC 50983]EER03615.1 homeobox-containing protein, putative [Perkinsus marinus ATCC 50983]|eukprot:XP_002771799.1 homeobox-containing protein, putative [Perkinsus marinus ATCC 50983]